MNLSSLPNIYVFSGLLYSHSLLWINFYHFLDHLNQLRRIGFFKFMQVELQLFVIKSIITLVVGIVFTSGAEEHCL